MACTLRLDFAPFVTPTPLASVAVVGFSFYISVIIFVFMCLYLFFVGLSLLVSLWFYLIVEPFAFEVCYSLMTDSVMISAVPPPPQPPLGDCYLTDVQVGLKGFSRVMPLLVFPSLEVRVELKGLAKGMHVPVLCFGSLAFAQDIEDRAVLGSSMNPSPTLCFQFRH